jgi:hypothetical protein
MRTNYFPNLTLSSNIPKFDTVGETTLLTPTLLEELPDSLLVLRAMEATLIDLLISFHYRLDVLKKDMMLAFEKGTTTKATTLWTERTALYKKKKRFETSLLKVQEKMKELTS